MSKHAVFMQRNIESRNSLLLSIGRSFYFLLALFLYVCFSRFSLLQTHAGCGAICFNKRLLCVARFQKIVTDEGAERAEGRALLFSELDRFYAFLWLGHSMRRNSTRWTNGSAVRAINSTNKGYRQSIVLVRTASDRSTHRNVNQRLLMDNK